MTLTFVALRDESDIFGICNLFLLKEKVRMEIKAEISKARRAKNTSFVFDGIMKIPAAGLGKSPKNDVVIAKCPLKEFQRGEPH